MMSAMKLRHEITYDAPAADVWTMLSDPAFRQKSCDAMGVLSSTIAIEPVGQGMKVRIDQVQRTEGIPSFAKKFAGDTTQAVQVEEWSDRRNATLTVKTPGKPTEITGTLTLTEEGGRTVETFDGECRVKVPLIGGKLEGLMSDLFRKGMDKEHQAGVAWLGGAR
jgi:carbon monoxide dehydrogenase subunit G